MSQPVPDDEPLVVPLRPAHVAGVLGLGHRVFDTAVKPYTSWSLSAVATHLDAARPACFAALAAGEVRGFVLGSLSFERRPDWGHLEWIAVDGALRGRGVARALLETCREALYAAGATAVVTDVEARNGPSSALMERAGFTVGATMNLYVHSRGAD